MQSAAAFPWVFFASSRLCVRKISPLISAGNFIDSPASGCFDQRHIDPDLIWLTRWQSYRCGRAVVFDLRCAYGEILLPTLVPILCADKYVRIHAADQPRRVCIELRRQILQRRRFLLKWVHVFEA